MTTDLTALHRRNRARTATLVVRVAGAALVAGNGYLHLRLYLLGYRSIPTIGPLFLLNAVLAGLLAVALLLAPRRLLPWTALAGGLFQAGTLGALALSVTTGLFGFTETLRAPYVTDSVVVESLGALLLLGYAAAALATRRGSVRGGSGRRQAARGG